MNVLAHEIAREVLAGEMPSEQRRQSLVRHFGQGTAAMLREANLSALAEGGGVVCWGEPAAGGACAPGLGAAVALAATSLAFAAPVGKSRFKMPTPKGNVRKSRKTRQNAPNPPPRTSTQRG